MYAPVMCTPNVASPNTAHAARSKSNARFLRAMKEVTIRATHVSLFEEKEQEGMKQLDKRTLLLKKIHRSRQTQSSWISGWQRSRSVRLSSLYFSSIYVMSESKMSSRCACEQAVVSGLTVETLAVHPLVLHVLGQPVHLPRQTFIPLI